MLVAEDIVYKKICWERPSVANLSSMEMLDVGPTLGASVVYGSSMSGLHIGRHCHKCVKYRCI